VVPHAQEIESGGSSLALAAAKDALLARQQVPFLLRQKLDSCMPLLPASAYLLSSHCRPLVLHSAVCSGMVEANQQGHGRSMLARGEGGQGLLMGA
jgi:hypothetical protein